MQTDNITYIKNQIVACAVLNQQHKPVPPFGVSLPSIPKKRSQLAETHHHFILTHIIEFRNKSFDGMLGTEERMRWNWKRKRNGSHHGKGTAEALKKISSTKSILAVRIRFDLATTNSDLKFNATECRIKNALRIMEEREDLQCEKREMVQPGRFEEEEMKAR